MTEQPADRVRERVRQLVDRAAGLGIAPVRVARYAILLAISELHTKRDEEIEVNREEAAVEFTRAQYGLPDDLDKESVERTHRQIRQAYQQISTSAMTAVSALEKLAGLIERQSANLPTKLKLELDAEREVLAVAQRIRKWAKMVQDDLDLDKDIKKLIEQNPNEYKPSAKLPKTTSQRTLLLWHRDVEDYPEKWNDMRALAGKWNISQSSGPDEFKRYVRKLASKFLLP